jgi:hypothetical protein
VRVVTARRLQALSPATIDAPVWLQNDMLGELQGVCARCLCPTDQGGLARQEHLELLRRTTCGVLTRPIITDDSDARNWSIHEPSGVRLSDTHFAMVPPLQLSHHHGGIGVGRRSRPASTTLQLYR